MNIVFVPYLRGFHKLRKLFGSSFFDSDKTIGKGYNTSVFIPIHFHPEATVDYWTDDHKHADYLNALVKVISFYKEHNIQVVLKEHPNYYLRRDLDFYRTLKRFENCSFNRTLLPLRKRLRIWWI